MSNVYNIRNSDNTIIATISETQRNTTATSLVLHGRGSKNYGFERDQNTLFLLEHFSGSQPLNPIDGQLWWNPGDQMYVYDTGSGSPWVTLVPAPEALGFNVIAGDGLTDGGAPEGSPLLTTLNVGQGTGITITANAVSTNDSEIVHDNLDLYVANEHIDHSSVEIVAGDGLTGGGDLTSSRTLTIGTGSGITTVGGELSVDSTVVRTFGSQVIDGFKLFSDPIQSGRQGSPANPATPSYAFEGSGAGTGMYRSNQNELSFSTGSIQRFRIESSGVLHSLNVTYEALITHDDDIPNKKYVDDVASSGGGGSSPTSNTFIGVSSIIDLTIGKKYLVTTHGTTRNAGTGSTTLGGCRLTQGTSPGSGTFIVASPSTFIDWPDGNIPQCVTHIITAPSTSIAGSLDYVNVGTFRTPRYMMAVQLD